jgi:hypothetical protein
VIRVEVATSETSVGIFWTYPREEMVGQALTWEEAVERLRERLEVGIYRKSEQ